MIFHPSGPACRSLVTGGSGFIGRHLVAALRARGDLVRVLDRAAPAALSPDDVELVQGSVLDKAAVTRALDGIDVVYHLAGIAHLWTRDVRDFDRVNRCGTEMMLSVARAKRVARFLHCSTEAILLPPRGGGTIDEAVSIRLADMAGPYTRSKYLAEQAALRAAQAGLPVVIVNPTLPVGPGDRDLTPPTAMLAHYLAGKSPFFLDCALNLVDVRDVALGMMLATERGRIGERYILGGENVSLGELTQTLGRMSGRCGRKLRVPGALALAVGHAAELIATRVTRRRPVVSAEGVRLALRSARFDSGKARRELGYAPQPVGEALAHAVSWLLGSASSDATAGRRAWIKSMRHSRV